MYFPNFPKNYIVISTARLLSFVFFVFHISVSGIATLREVRLVGGKVHNFSWTFSGNSSSW